MIQLLTIGRALDVGSRVIREVAHHASVSELARAFPHPEWAPGAELQHYINSMPVDGNVVPKDGDFVTVAPKVGEPVSIAFAVLALAFNTASYIRAKRASDKAKRAQELRDQKAYGFDTPSLTAYGEGFRIPIGYGEYRTGGTVIGNRIEQSTLVRLGTELSLQIALGYGPIESIGGLTLNPQGERDYLTNAEMLLPNRNPDPRFPFNTYEFPAGLRLNGLETDGKQVSVSLRKGNINQSPMSDWATAATSVDVSGLPLTTEGNSTTYVSTAEGVFRVQAVLRFPEGLWFDGSSGITGRRVDFRLEWKQGNTAWSGRDVSYTSNPPMPNAFDYVTDFQVPIGSGPLDLRVTRLGIPGHSGNGDHGDRAHSVFSLQSVQIQYGTAFSYPGLALLGVRMPGSEQLNGQLNNVSTLIRARKVRGWISEALGWTAESWGPVAPWVHPLSSNPAWAALDLMLSTRYGLGHLLRERDIDLPAFRDWADFCDQPHPLDAAQPLLRWDGEFATGVDAIEALAAIFAAGRAVPIPVAQKFSVRFSYRDGFSRGSGGTLNTVPDRVPVGIISTSSCRDFSIQYSDPATAPQAIAWQFLDRDADYEMRTIELEDAGIVVATLGDRPLRRSPRKESSQVAGVVRRLQVRYEIQLQHNRNRLSRRTASVRMPLQALPYELGDLVLLQHDALAPLGTHVPSGTQSCRTRTGGTVSSVVVSKRVVVQGTGSTPRTDFGVWLFDVNGVERQLTANYLAPTTIDEGGTLDLWDPVALAPASVTIQKGTELILGPFASTRQVYEVTAITTEQDMTRRMELEEWHPEMYDMPDSFDETEGLGELDAPLVVEAASTASVAVAGTVTEGEGFRSSASVLWSPGESAALNRLARVYARTEDGRFSLLGETSADRLEGLHLYPGSTYELHVCRQTSSGVFPLPGQVTPVTVTVPEFGNSLPGTPVRLSYLVDQHRVHLHWPVVDDAAAYEIRRGETWYGAEVLGVTNGTTFDALLPPAGTSRYLLRARGRSGLYSAASAQADVLWQPINVLATATYLTANVSGGTATDVTWNGTVNAAAISGSVMRGTWTAPAVDMGKDIFAHWSAGARVWAVDGSVSLSTFSRGDPSRFFETAGGRQATRLYPGADFDAGIATVPVDGYEDVNLTSEALGEWVREQVQTRYHVAGAWGPWGKHVSGWRLARQMEARVQLDRYATDINPYAKTFVVTVGQ